MGSSSYTPRHAPRHAAPKRPNRGALALRAAVRRPAVGGAVAVAMLGSVGATVAIGSPAETDGMAAAMTAPVRDAQDSSGDRTGEDTARLAEVRRTTNVSRSAAREELRRADLAEKKAKAAKAAKAEAEKKAKEKAEKKRRAAEEAAKPVSERDFSAAEIAAIQKNPKPYAIELMREYGWSDDQWGCLEQLWVGESNWTWNATNSSSGAYGIPQSLPAEKMATAGSDWRTNPVTQIDWGLNYIKLSYGSPCGALNFWNAQNPHWY